MRTTSFLSSRGFSLAAAAALLLCGISAGAPAASADVLINLNLSSPYNSNGNSNPFTPAPNGTQAAFNSGNMDWNNLQAASVNTTFSDSSLLDSNGNTVSSVAVSVDPQSGGYNSNPADVSSINTMLYTYMAGGLKSSDPATVTFSGLDKTGTTSYNLYSYNWYDYTTAGTTWTATSSITAAGGTLPAAQTNSYTGAESGTLFTPGVNYVAFNGLTANSSGDITLSVIGTGAVLNGVQLDAVGTSAVPEPATLGVAGAGLCLLLLLKKKRQVLA